MTRIEIMQSLKSILSQFQKLSPSLTTDNTDGQQADIDECTWRLAEVVEEMNLTTAIANQEVTRNG